MAVATASAETPLGKGVFLVATPGLHDPNFSRTVVLLLAYGEEGAMGVVINRPTGHDLADLAPEEDLPRPCPLHFGGPVKLDGVMAIVRGKPLPEGAVTVLDDDVAMVRFEDAKGLEARYYAGHAGWGPGQLEGELFQGGWHVLPGNARYVFDVEADLVWPQLARRELAQAAPPGGAGPLAPCRGPYVSMSNLTVTVRRMRMGRPPCWPGWNLHCRTASMAA
jgi:putative transcriptional regulator